MKMVVINSKTTGSPALLKFEPDSCEDYNVLRSLENALRETNNVWVSSVSKGISVVELTMALGNTGPKN